MEIQRENIALCWVSAIEIILAKHRQKRGKRPASTNNNARGIINIIILDIQLSRKIDKTSSNGGIDVRRI